jgi:thiol peroxidase
MMEVTRKGQVFQVEGSQLTVGTKAPLFSLKDQNEQVFRLEDFLGKTVLISVVPDLATRVCSLQTRTFNQAAAQLAAVKFVTISNNTALEQADWCAAEGIDMEILHDTEGTFGKAYGLYIPEFGHLARAVLVIDGTGTVVYQEILADISSEPDYQAALAAAKQA